MNAESLKMTTFPVGSFACNCSIIWSEKTKEALIVDPGNDPRPVLSFLAKEGLTAVSLLHTHAHFDHIGHSPYLSEHLKTPLLLHKQDLFLYENLSLQAKYFREPVCDPIALHNFLEDGQLVYLKDKIKSDKVLATLECLHTPGHTPGSCCFLSKDFEMPLLFTGDTLFLNSIGRTDLPGGDYDEIIRSIKQRLLKLPEETICIPGHGTQTTIGKEKRSNPFL